VNAVQCAVEIQTTLKAENANIPPERRMEFRIGLNLRDVMVDGEQIYGDGVNVAARLGSLAAPGGICSSRTVREQIRNKLTLNYEDLGEQAVKNRLLPQAQHRPPKRGISPPNWSDLSPWGCASQDHELLMEDHVLCGEPRWRFEERAEGLHQQA
jgi:class 3 adenylate cyclase